MTLNAGSAARVLVAWAPASLQQAVLPTAAYSAAELERVRQTQISESVAERDASLASASVPIFDSTGTMVADRKSTRLNSSHVSISYAVFCLKKKNVIAEIAL